MGVIEKLWRGKLCPAARKVCENSEYERLHKQLIEKDNILTAELSADEKKLLRECEEIQNRMNSISEEDIFVQAFRLGVSVILEVIGDYEGQFSPCFDE